MELDRAMLVASIEAQRQRLAESIVLTPVDSISFSLPDRDLTGALHGLYLSDKVRTDEQKIQTVVQFAGRDQAASDLDAIHALLAQGFGAPVGSMRLLSGLHAHAATFMSIADIGQSVAVLPELGGGHFSTRSILERLGLTVVDLPIDIVGRCVDRSASMDMVNELHPDFVFVDRSEGLRYEDFSFLGDLPNTTTVFDASQFAAQILTGRYPSPISWGFDLVLLSLHKSFPGPQKASIVGREDGVLWQRLLAGLSTFVSSSHAENSYLAGLALLRTEWLETYCDRMLATAIALEHELARRGVPVIQRVVDDASLATQHVWIRAEDRAQAFEWFSALERVNILANYRKLPYDLGYGLRLGTTCSSVAGLTVPLVGELAQIIADALIGADDRDLRTSVRELARRCHPDAIVPIEYWATP